MRIRMRGLLLVTAAGLGLALVAPSDARAGGDHFENGFKDELGRVAAHEAFGIGRHILAEVLLGGHYAHGYQRPIHHRTYYRHGARYYDDYDYGDRHHYRHKRHHYKPHKRHYRHHRRHHGRGHYHDCDH